MRPAALGMGDEGCGVAVFGRNFDLLVDHEAFLLAFLFIVSGPQPIRLQGNQGMTRRLALWEQ
jgi:hypothetical protein